MRKSFKLAMLSALLTYFLCLPAVALAQVGSSTSGTPLLDKLQMVGDKGGYNTDPAVASTPIIIGTVVGAFINFSGIVFIILMVVAGYSWMTSSGNEEKTKKAMATIKTAIIGLVVSLSAWVLWNFIFEKLILQA